MSLPLHNASQPSSSPSKSALRRRSGAGGSRNPSTNTLSSGPAPTTHFAAETQQRHFLPHSPPNQNLDYEDEDDSEEQEQEQAIATGYSDEASYQTAPQPQQPFQPFFALIEDTYTNEHYHPTVHYIFADDEPDIITEAACRSLEQDTEQPEEGSNLQSPQQPSHDDALPHETRLPQRRPGVREHYLILDVRSTPSQSQTQPSTLSSDRLPSPSPSSFETAHPLSSIKTYPYTVSKATSLSSDWQVLRTTITDAPTMNPAGAPANQEHPEEQHLMLQIEGRGNSPDKIAPARREGETMEDMVERLQRRLAEVRGLVGNLDLLEEEAEEDPRIVQEGGEEIEEGGDVFTQGGLVGMGLRRTGFGNAVLDEQD